MSEQQKKSFEDMIVEAVKGYCEERMEESLTEKVDALMDSLLGDLFRSYGDLSKALKEKIEGEMAVDLQRVDFSQYREELLALTQRRVDALWNQQMKEAVDKSLAEVLREPPETVTMSQLVELMKADHIEYKSPDEYPAECVAYVEHDGGRFAMVYLHPEEGTSGYQCDYRIHLSRCDQEPEEGQPQLWEAIGVHLPDDTSFDRKRPNRFLGRMDEIEKYLFHLYASGTKLILDENRVDTCYPDPFD